MSTDPLSLAFVAVSAVVPSLMLMWYFHRRDAYPEPPRVVWATFGLGVAITLPAALLALPGDLLARSLADPLAHGFTGAFLAAAIPEELLKLLVLWRYAARRSELDEPMDGVVYGVAASLGFATLENVLYVAQGGLAVAAVRALTAVPGHAFFGAVMGYFVGQARFAERRRRRRLLGRAVAVPIALHGLYDFPLLAAGKANEVASIEPAVLWLLLVVPAVLVAAGVWSVGRVRRLRTAQLARPRPRQGAADLAERRPAPAGPAPPADHPGRLGGWVLTVLGALAGSLGGLITLGVLAGLAFFGVEPEELGPLAAGTAILGLLPLGLGLALFVRGVQRLNRAADAPAGATGDRPRPA